MLTTRRTRTEPAKTVSPNEPKSAQRGSQTSTATPFRPSPGHRARPPWPETYMVNPAAGAVKDPEGSKPVRPLALTSKLRRASRWLKDRCEIGGRRSGLGAAGRPRPVQARQAHSHRRAGAGSKTTSIAPGGNPPTRRQTPSLLYLIGHHFAEIYRGASALS